jgi:hypothetical protein
MATLLYLPGSGLKADRQTGERFIVQSRVAFSNLKKLFLFA